jgi:pimeloyl-ACP methyl ester carboxylesterase
MNPRIWSAISISGRFGGMAQLQRRSQARTIVPIVTATTALAGVGLALAWVAYSRNRVPHAIPMTAALDAELKYFDSPSAGPIGYYAGGVAQRGKKPLLLIHSVNAAASSFEMRPLFERLAQTHRVYALDLPGFGFSSRMDRDYTPELMRDAILDFSTQVLKKEPVNAVALSLGCEFLAQAAVRAPNRFKSLTLLSPTGLGTRSRQVRPLPRLRNALRAPFWSRPLFDLLTTRVSISFFTKKSANNPMPASFADYAYEASHQPNAQFAPYAFLSNGLFSPNIIDAYNALTMPVLMLHGDDQFAGYGLVEQALSNPNWRIAFVAGAGALPHWDSPDNVAQQIDAHLR